MWHFQGTPFMTESVCNNICLSYEKYLILEKMFVINKSQSIENTYYFFKNTMYTSYFPMHTFGLV